MAIATGTPLGSVISQGDLYVEGAPVIYFQDSRATPLNNPDAQGYYWNLSGTTAYPAYLLGCIQDVSLTQGLTMNDVRCDTVGVVDTIQKRDYVEFQLTILSQLPLKVLSKMLNLSAATTGTGYEKVGIPQIDNSVRYHVYAPKIYDPTDPVSWLMFYLHKAKFVDAWTINMQYGQAWTTTGIKLRAYADDTKPAAQLFGTIARFDNANRLP
jgi:hypothetical protein